MDDCLFCKIASGEIPCDKVYEDEHIMAFKDKFPKAPVHVLVIPKRHIVNLMSLTQADGVLIQHLTLKLSEIAADCGLEGFRTIVNTGEAGGQEIFHLHYHILGAAQGKLPGF